MAVPKGTPSQSLVDVKAPPSLPTTTMLEVVEISDDGKYVRPNDTDIPPESDSNDDEVMAGYPMLFTRLWNTTGVRAHGYAQIHSLSHDKQQKLDIAIWSEGQWCPFVCCRILNWNPGGVKVYCSRSHYLQHLCEIHCPLLQEWSFPLIKGSSVSYTDEGPHILRQKQKNKKTKSPHSKGLGWV